MIIGSLCMFFNAKLCVHNFTLQLVMRQEQRRPFDYTLVITDLYVKTGSSIGKEERRSVVLVLELLYGLSYKIILRLVCSHRIYIRVSMMTYSKFSKFNYFPRKIKI